MAQQLSKQDHYDFGLRPIRAALQRAGEIKRQASESMVEQAAVIQAILDMVVPKTVPDDLDILFALVKDLFPEAELAEVSMVCLNWPEQQRSNMGKVHERVLRTFFRVNPKPLGRLWK